MPSSCLDSFERISIIGKKYRNLFVMVMTGFIGWLARPGSSFTLTSVPYICSNMLLHILYVSVWYIAGRSKEGLHTEGG